MELREELRLSLGGPNEIQMDTLIEVLKGTLDTLKSLTDDQIQDGGYRNFVVKKIAPGSFVLEILSIIVRNPQESLFVTSSVLVAFKTILDIKKHLKGSMPKEVVSTENGIIITNSDDNMIIVNQYVYDKYSTDSDIDLGIQRVFKALGKDDDRINAEFLIKAENSKDETNRVVVISNEFEDFQKPVQLKPINPKVREEIFESNVRLGKVDFSGDSRWSIYIAGGIRETAIILDEAFLKDVKFGKYLFGTSTIMKVQLRSRYEINDEGFPIESKKRDLAILRVLEVHNERHEDIVLLS